MTLLTKSLGVGFHGIIGVKSVDFKENKEEDFIPADAHDLGEWLFVPKKGFFLKDKEQSQLEKKLISKDRIDDHLEKNSMFFKKHLNALKTHPR